LPFPPSSGILVPLQNERPPATLHRPGQPNTDQAIPRPPSTQGAAGLLFSPAASIPADRTLYERQIEATDRQIDALVYELYDLTAEEIAIVEGR
jgi:hypothetical protein